MTRVLVRNLIASGALRVEDGNHGNDRPRPEEFIEKGAAYIRASDMSSGDVDFAHASKINAAARARIRKGVGSPGDVLLSHKGTVGAVAVAPKDAPEFVCSPQTTFWRSLDANVVQQGFLRYMLQSPDFKRQLAVLGGQTDMAPYVSLTDQRSMQFDLPSATEQLAIAEVLGALDDKIAADAAVISRSDALASALFCSSATDVRPLSSIARFVNGRAFTKAATGTGRVVVRIAELNSGLGSSTVRNDLQVPDEHLVRPGDLLFAWSGSLRVARWFRAEAIVNQHIFKVMPNADIPLWLVAQAIEAKLDEFKAIAANKATTMGHIQRHHLDEPVLIPSPDAIERIDDLMRSLWDRALAAEVESVTLAKVRDELLPLLMSGKVRVGDAERIVADTV